MYKIIAVSSILAFCLVMAIMNFHREKAIIHTSTVVETTAELDSIDVIDTTEIMIDKKLFVCIGDIDLDISDVGVVSFDCQTEEKKVHIVTNPQDMFITQYLIKKEL
jgi:hypothetical protein